MSRFTCVVHEVECLGRQRRSRRRHRPQAGKGMRLGRAESGFHRGVDELRRRAEERHPRLVGEGEEPVPVRMKRRPVVEEDCRARGQHGHQPVPHHPPERGEVEHAVAGPDIAVQLMLLQVLNERTARAMHDALGYARRPRGVEHVQRMIERQPGVHRRRAAMRRQEALPSRRPDDGALDRRQARDDLRHFRAQVEPLAAVHILVGGD